MEHRAGNVIVNVDKVLNENEKDFVVGLAEYLSRLLESPFQQVKMVAGISLVEMVTRIKAIENMLKAESEKDELL